MHDAKKIYIAGVGASKFGAQWLHYTLNMLRPDVELLVMVTVGLLGFFASLVGFTTLVGKVYSTMGYIGFALIITIVIAWFRKTKKIAKLKVVNNM